MVGVRATSRGSLKACRAHTSRSSVRTRWTANVVARERATLHLSRRAPTANVPRVRSLGRKKICGYRRNGSVLRIAAPLAEQSVCRSRTVAERLLKVFSVDDGGTTRHTNVLGWKKECARFTLICADFVLRDCVRLVNRGPGDCREDVCRSADCIAIRTAVRAEDSALVL